MMKNTHSGRLPHWCTLAVVAVRLSVLPASAEDPTPVSLYDKDSQHLWNRLSSALITRAPEGKTVPPDLLDPPHLDLLLEGSMNREAVALLGEFIKEPQPDAMTPLQRAVMQRDLLAVFHRVAIRRSDWSGPERELSAALARAIRHIALSAAKIRQLPDNYAAATALPEAVTVDDPAHPSAFLPKDLLTDEGAWIALEALEGGRGLVPQFHFKYFHGRSSFEVRMRHPEGRAAGENYLKSLADMPQPFLLDKPAPGDRLELNRTHRASWPNPATPQFPIGTMWALVRRAMLVDEMGQLVVSPLVESIQIRVYRHVTRGDALKSPEFSKQVKALEDAKVAHDFDDLLGARYQTSFEWEVKRSLLLGKGGFHLTQPEDLKYSGFVPSPRARSIAVFCMQCHSTDGIHSVQSRAGLFSDSPARPPEFKPSDRARLDRITTEEARSQPGWLLLQWLWQDPPGR